MKAREIEMLDKKQSAAGEISYVVSRRPENKRKRIIVPANTALFTPSGGRVPPAWTEVWMTTDAKSPLQATGRDSKNRRVYLYSAEHMGMATAAKFARLKQFSKAYPVILKRIRRDKDTSEEALVLYLISKTGFRIGSNEETRAEVKAFGASTLHCSHVKADDNKILFDFTGKKGIRVSKELRDAFLAKIISARCRSAGNIFKTTDDAVRRYLDSIPSGAGFTVKDFRTYLGTLTAFKRIKTMPPPRTIREFKSYRREVGRTVARELGNSTAIALKSYVSPEVFCYWEPTNDFVDKDGKKRPSLTNDFLDCVHYDKTVPPAETSGTAPD